MLKDPKARQYYDANYVNAEQSAYEADIEDAGTTNSEAKSDFGHADSEDAADMICPLWISHIRAEIAEEHEQMTAALLRTRNNLQFFKFIMGKVGDQASYDWSWFPAAAAESIQAATDLSASVTVRADLFTSRLDLYLDELIGLPEVACNVHAQIRRMQHASDCMQAMLMDVMNPRGESLDDHTDGMRVQARIWLKPIQE